METKQKGAKQHIIPVQQMAKIFVWESRNLRQVVRHR